MRLKTLQQFFCARFDRIAAQVAEIALCACLTPGRFLTLRLAFEALSAK